MDDIFSKNSAIKNLGLWICVCAIVLALLICGQSEGPGLIPPVAEAQEILPALILSSPPSTVPVSIARFETESNDEAQRQAVDSHNDVQIDIDDSSRTEPVSLPPAMPEAKARADHKPRKKMAPLRGKRAERLFRPFIMRAAQRHQVDPALVQAIIMAESSFNPNAVSNRGAVGLMQLMPSTAKALGVKDVFNPEHNINGGVLYFKKMLKEFRGNVRLALAAYNAGSRKVKEYQDVPPFKTTQTYVNKVFEYYRYYKNRLAADDETA